MSKRLLTTANATKRQGTYTTGDIASRYGIDRGKVLAWIHSGQLRAVNIAENPGGRPRWRIPPDALADFEKIRSSRPPAAVSNRNRKNSGVTQFFKA